MFVVLLTLGAFASRRRVEVESKRLELGLTEKTQKFFDEAPTYQLGDHDISGTVNDIAVKGKLTDITLGNVVVGDVIVGLNYPYGGSGETMVIQGLNVTFDVDGTLTLEEPSGIDIVNPTFTNVGSGTTHTVHIMGPELKKASIGHVNGTCEPEVMIDADVTGTYRDDNTVIDADTVAAINQVVTDAIRAKIKDVICNGGTDPNMPMADTGGVLGIFPRVNELIDTHTNPDIADANVRSADLVNATNNRTAGWNHTMDDMVFAGFGLTDILVKDYSISGVDLFQTVIDPKMYAPKDHTGTYFSMAVKGIRMLMAFNVKTWFASEPATITVKDAFFKMILNFDRDSNKWIINPKLMCKLSLPFVLNIRGEGPLWRAFLDGFNRVLRSSLESRICSKMHEAVKTKLTPLLAQDSQVFANVIEHEDDDEYDIDDDRFEPLGWTDDWADDSSEKAFEFEEAPIRPKRVPGLHRLKNLAFA